MSGNGTSMNFSVETSTPCFCSEALIVTSQMFFSVLTAIVLPSRSFAVLIGPFLRTSRSAHAWDLSVPARTPWLIIWTGRPFDAAISSEIVFEKPIWSLPLRTAGVMAAPPSASLGLIVRFCSLKKPFLMPRYSGATSAIGMTPTLSVAGLAAWPDDALLLLLEPPPLSPPPHAARTSAAPARSAVSAGTTRRGRPARDRRWVTVFVPPSTVGLPWAPERRRQSFAARCAQK